MWEKKEVAEAKCKDLEWEKNINWGKSQKSSKRLPIFRRKKKFEELRARFATEKEELNEDYHKQVDEMFFFGYQCCMKKNGITHDIPSYPFDEEDATVSGPAHEDKDSDVVGPFKGQWLYFCTFFFFSSCSIQISIM